MTTYSFVDFEATYTKSSANMYLGGNTVYTVPSGKIAKIEFDSFHISQSGNNTFNLANVLLYSEGTNIKRKHTLLFYNGSTGDHSSLHWFNPNVYGRMDTAGGGTNLQSNSTMSAQPQDWSANGSVDTTPDSNCQHVTFQGSNFGARVLGPAYWYMEAGEVLKVISRGEFASTISGNMYANARLMVFLEDS